MENDMRAYTIEEVFNGYKDNKEEGVIALGGNLDIRPSYQREFVYNEKQRNAVIETVVGNLPLNLMYWAKTGPNTYEVLDGQQRTLSICHYLSGSFSFNGRFFQNLTKEEQHQILDYGLLVCTCQGTSKELLEWFEKVNVVGEKLTEQELRNAVYTGPWLLDAKQKFSKSGCPAYLLAQDGGCIVKGSPLRQDLLETALKWISGNKIEEYMAAKQHETDADELWNYYRDVIDWVRRTFVVYRPEMQRVSWGDLYNDFGKSKLNAIEIEDRVKTLMLDEDVTKKPGIYTYILTQEEKYLNIRAFSDSQKRETYEKQSGICTKCGKPFPIEAMEADHITPWHEGGRTNPENCQMLCKQDNRAKSGK